MQFNGDEEQAYIDKKTTEIFNTGFAHSNTEYVAPKGWKRECLTLNNVAVERFAAEKPKSDRVVVLFLHGGGYVGGLNSHYRDWAVHLAELAGGAELLAVDYRIAPQYKYPAALDDAVAAYEAILANGYNPDKMIIMGDSAGGNLSAALMLALRDNNLPLPKLAILISPWTSFSKELPSRIRNSSKDVLLGEKNKKFNSEVNMPSYGDGISITEPYLSPVYADLTGLPKMLIVSGSYDLLLDDAVLFAQNAENDGVDVTLSIYKGMSHDWTLILPELPESKAMFNEITGFVNKGMKR